MGFSDRQRRAALALAALGTAALFTALNAAAAERMVLGEMISMDT